MSDHPPPPFQHPQVNAALHAAEGPDASLWRVTESSVGDLVDQVKQGQAVSARAGHALLYTGFATLDKALSGGMHIGDLTIVGGLPGSGKTIAALQWARNMAMAGNQVLYLCYEHDVATLLGRLMAMEIGNLDAHLEGEDARSVSEALSYTMNGAGNPDSTVLKHPVARAALAQIETYADRLVLSQAPNHCDLSVIEAKVNEGDYDVLVVDYLQKVPSEKGLDGIDRYTNTVEGLKNLALETECLVVAVSAVDSAALSERRLKLEGLRGAHALAHEADVVLTLNAKLSVVSKAHLAFDTTLYDEFARYVVFTVEKNRRGMAPLTVEFEKDFAFFRFDQKGRFVAEKLIDDLIVSE